MNSFFLKGLEIWTLESKLGFKMLEMKKSVFSKPWWGCFLYGSSVEAGWGSPHWMLWYWALGSLRGVYMEHTTTTSELPLDSSPVELEGLLRPLSPVVPNASSFLLWLVQFLLSVVLVQTLGFLLSFFPLSWSQLSFYTFCIFFLLLKELKPHALGLCMFSINGTLLHFLRNPFIWRIGVGRSVFFQNNC